jgi:SAM-dependent methyltransferase
MRRWLFEFKYLSGRAPWNSGVVPPEVVAEVEAASSPGRALDLGCGSGTTCIYLARHGWEVTGVDFSALAIWQARRKARRAGLRIAFYRADISDLSFLDGPFDLALDIGCLHSVPLEKRSQAAAEVARLVRPAGLYMLYAFLPRPARRAPGLAPSQVIDLFGGAFAIERQEQGKDPNGPVSAWYWLRRR